MTNPMAEISQPVSTSRIHAMANAAPTAHRDGAVRSIVLYNYRIIVNILCVSVKKESSLLEVFYNFYLICFQRCICVKFV